MKLWLIQQTANEGYDTYDSAVVAAETEEDARRTHPASMAFEDWMYYRWSDDAKMWIGHRKDGSTYFPSGNGWTTPDRVRVRLIGEAVDVPKVGAICSSFNAG